MKNTFKLFLLLVTCGIVKADVPALGSIICSSPDTLTFTAQSSDGRWEGILSATGMWTMQMHMVGGRPMTSSQHYLHMFVQKHLSDGDWGWRLQSQTSGRATYATTHDTRVLLKLIASMIKATLNQQLKAIIKVMLNTV